VGVKQFRTLVSEFGDPCNLTFLFALARPSQLGCKGEEPGADLFDPVGFELDRLVVVGNGAFDFVGQDVLRRAGFAAAAPEAEEVEVASLGVGEAESGSAPAAEDGAFEVNRDGFIGDSILTIASLRDGSIQ